MIFNITIVLLFIFCYFVEYFMVRSNLEDKRISGTEYIFIPDGAYDDDEIKNIMSSYSKNMKIRTYASSLISLVGIFLSDELCLALVISVLAVWMVAMYVNNNKTQKAIDEYVNQNYIELNCEEEIVHVDLDILDKSNEGIVKNTWFVLNMIFTTAVGVICSLFEGFDMTFFLVMTLTSAVVWLICIGLNNLVRKDKNLVYGTDSKVNLEINREEKANRSRIYFSIAVLNSLIFSFIWINYVVSFPTVIILLVLFITTILQIVYMIKCNKNIQIQISKIPDEDRIPNERFYRKNNYILGGIFYYDKDNKRTFITEKYRFNFVPNLATVGGKIFGIFIGASLALVLLMPIGLFISAFSYTDVEVNNNQLEFSYPVYSEKIDLNKIESFEILDKFPNIKMRTNGIGTEGKQIGYFKIEGYSSSKIYFQGDELPILHIKTQTRDYFVNSNKRLDVNKIYKELESLQKLGELKK